MDSHEGWLLPRRTFRKLNGRCQPLRQLQIAASVGPGEEGFGRVFEITVVLEGLASTQRGE